MSYKGLRTQKDFMKVVYAGVVNTIGDCFDSLAMSFLVYELTGSKFWFAINFAVNAIPNLLIQPFLGVLIERLSKKWVMVFADVARAVLVGILLLLHLNTVLSPYVVLLFTFAMTCMEAFRQPAAMSLQPQILEAEFYDHGVSFRNTITTASQLIGTSLAGIFIARFGVASALGVDLISFVVSALILMLIKKDSKSDQSKQNTYIHDLKAGWSYFIQHPFVLRLSLFSAMAMICLTGLNVMIVPFILEDLSMGVDFVSYFMSIQLVFSIVASMLYPKLHERFKAVHLFVGAGLCLALGFGLIASLGLWPGVYAGAFVAAMFVGLGAGLLMPTLNVSFMKSVDKAYMGRCSALFNSVIFASMPLGSLLVGFLMNAFSMGSIFLVYGIMLTLVYLVFQRDPSLKSM